MLWRRLKLAWRDRGLRGRLRIIEEKIWGIRAMRDDPIPAIKLLGPSIEERLEAMEQKVAALAERQGVVLHKSRVNENPYRALKPKDVPKRQRSMRSYLYDEDDREW
jgi:hypothetical protein